MNKVLPSWDFASKGVSVIKWVCELHFNPEDFVRLSPAYGHQCSAVPSLCGPSPVPSKVVDPPSTVEVLPASGTLQYSESMATFIYF